MGLYACECNSSDFFSLFQNKRLSFDESTNLASVTCPFVNTNPFRIFFS